MKRLVLILVILGPQQEVGEKCELIHIPSGLTMHSCSPMLGVMDTARAATSFAELFSDLYLRLYQRMDPRVWRPSQEALLMLQHLASTGPLTVTEAALHFDRSQAAVSELIARLMRRKLLARMADERDRRRHLEWLTDEGKQLLRRTTQVLSPELLETALARLTPQDRSQLIQHLSALLEATDSTTQKGGAKK